MEMYIDDIDGGSEDTLSLCDLQVSGDADDSHQRSITSFDQDFFGFFTEEYISDQTDEGSNYNYNYNPPVISSSTPLPENIIFCGKLIPMQKPEPAETKPINNLMVKQKSICQRLFRWNSDSGRSRSSAAASKVPISTSRSKSLLVVSRSSYNDTSDSKDDIYVRRAPSLLSFPTMSKSSPPRWFLFMFGSGRVRTRMEMSDLRSRQLKHNPTTISEWNNEVVEGNASRKGGKGLLWRWISVLGCGGGYGRNDAVKASFGRISHV